MNKPALVTFTGVDERTPLPRLLTISSRYHGRVEWGILFSSTNGGRSPRYPSLSVVRDLFDSNLRASSSLSAHICGRWAENIIERGDCPVDLVRFLMGNVDRVQINVADGETKVHGPVRPERAASFGDLIGAQAILQRREAFPPGDSVSWLFDRSGGAGVRETRWPLANNSFNGYAGGIGPDTIDDDLIAVSEASNKFPYWIDMESHVRTGDWLDLDKCERVLEAVYG